MCKCKQNRCSFREGMQKQLHFSAATSEPHERLKWDKQQKLGHTYCCMLGQLNTRSAYACCLTQYCTHRQFPALLWDSLVPGWTAILQSTALKRARVHAIIHDTTCDEQQTMFAVRTRGNVYKCLLSPISLHSSAILNSKLCGHDTNVCVNRFNDPTSFLV